MNNRRGVVGGSPY